MQRPTHSLTTTLLWLLCFLLTGLHVSVEGAVLSSSALKSCIRDGSSETTTDGEQELQCDEKMVLTLSVGDGHALATEELQLDLRCIGSPTGQCPCPCNYEMDEGCTCRDIETPVKIWLTKTPVFASYPLEYIESYNYKPVEVIVRPDSNECKADDYEDEPTCGWYWKDGEQMADSQGFTCVCSSQQVWDHTFTGSNKRTRSSLNCDFFTDPFDILMGNRPCSAHCLTFDPLWYSGYRVGSSQLQFEIEAHILVEDPAANSTSSTGEEGKGAFDFPDEELTLSPSVPLAVSESKLASLRLLGDLATYEQTAVLSSNMLLIPQPDGANLEDIQGSDRSKWLLLDKNFISLDGSSCNQVGTSFEAFRYQTDGCFRAPQVCLQNQIKDLIADDEERIDEGKVPRHLVTRYTYGSHSMLESFDGGRLSLAIPLSSESTSLVTISASADSMRFVTNRASGEITDLKLCTFEEERCGGFEAGASRGYIWANLTNTGSVAASFTLTVSNCSVNVRPIEATQLALRPGEAKIVRPPPELFVEDIQADTDRHCWVDLYNSQGTVTDSKRMGFYTNATVFDDKPKGGFEGEGDGPGDGPKRPVDCDEVCDNAMDAACFVVNSCWGHFGGFLGILAGIAAGIALLAILAKTGMLTAALSAVARCLCAAGGGKDRRDSSQEKRKQSYAVGGPVDPHHGAAVPTTKGGPTAQHPPEGKLSSAHKQQWDYNDPKHDSPYDHDPEDPPIKPSPHAKAVPSHNHPHTKSPLLLAPPPQTATYPRRSRTPSPPPLPYPSHYPFHNNRPTYNSSRSLSPHHHSRPNHSSAALPSTANNGMQGTRHTRSPSPVPPHSRSGHTRQARPEQPFVRTHGKASAVTGNRHSRRSRSPSPMMMRRHDEQQLITEREWQQQQRALRAPPPAAVYENEIGQQRALRAPPDQHYHPTPRAPSPNNNAAVTSVRGMESGSRDRGTMREQWDSVSGRGLEGGSSSVRGKRPQSETGGVSVSVQGNPLFDARRQDLRDVI